MNGCLRLGRRRWRWRGRRLFIPDGRRTCWRRSDGFV